MLLRLAAWLVVRVRDTPPLAGVEFASDDCSDNRSIRHPLLEAVRSSAACAASGRSLYLSITIKLGLGCVGTTARYC